MTKENTYRLCIIILAVLVYLLAHRACSDVKTIITQGETIIKSDTTYTQGIPETTHLIVEKPIEVPFYIDRWNIIHDTVYINDTTSKYVDKYMQPFEDSLISGNMYIDIRTDSCQLNKVIFEYTPKFPKYITRADTLKIENKILAQRSLLFGGTIGGNATNFLLKVKGGFRTNKGIDYLYEYDVFNKTHNIGLTAPIRWQH